MAFMLHFYHMPQSILHPAARGSFKKYKSHHITPHSFAYNYLILLPFTFRIMKGHKFSFSHAELEGYEAVETMEKASIWLSREIWA